MCCNQYSKSNAISLHCSICIIKISSSLSKCLPKNKIILGSFSENFDVLLYLLLQESVPLPTSIPTVLKEAHVHHLTYQTPFSSKVRIEEENFQKRTFTYSMWISKMPSHIECRSREK